MQRVEGQLKSLLRSVDTDLLSQDERKAIANMRRLIVDARLDIRDYELSETREEQLKKMHAAKRRLAKLEATILAASIAFGPADVGTTAFASAAEEGYVLSVYLYLSALLAIAFPLTAL